MAEAKWVKFEVNMFDDTKLKIIDNLDKRDLIIYIWTRLLVLAGKINCGGYLYITDNMAYTIKTLAIEVNRSIDEVKTALKVLKNLEMIEFTEDKVFKIKNWEKHQNVEGLERIRNLNNDRVIKHRAKKKETKIINEELANNHVPEIDESNKAIIKNNEEINYKEASDKVTPVEDEKGNTSDFTKETVDAENNNTYATENTADNIDNNINDDCNVTSNYNNSSCNVTVMEQKKTEKKKKMEKKIENESDDTRGEEMENNLIEFSDSSHSAESNKNINNQAIASLLNHYENITGICGGLNLGSIKLAISMHGYESVKMAMNKAIEVNKPNMTYINGILKNWRREGYPKEGEGIRNGVRSTGKNNSADKNEFTGFKPKKSRNLTEAQRKGAEKNLI